MPRGRKLAPLKVSEADRTQLQGVANSTTMPHALVLRARMILASAEGITNAAVAHRVGASPQAVGKWRKRYLDGSIQGLHDELRPRRPRTYDDERVAWVINRALRDRPPTPPTGAPTAWVRPRASRPVPRPAGSACSASIPT